MRFLTWGMFGTTLLILFLALTHISDGYAQPHLLPVGTPSTPIAPNADVWVEQARLLSNADRPTAALRLLDEALAFDDLDDVAAFRAYFLRGQIYQQQENLERALRDYSEAISLQPTIAEVYAFRATVHFSLTDYESALADYEQAINFDSTTASYHLAAGIVRVQLEEYDAAINSFSAALELDEDLNVAYRERGLAALAAGDDTQAAEDLEAYLDASPRATDAAEIAEILNNLR